MVGMRMRRIKTQGGPIVFFWFSPRQIFKWMIFHEKAKADVCKLSTRRYLLK